MALAHFVTWHPSASQRRRAYGILILVVPANSSHGVGSRLSDSMCALTLRSPLALLDEVKFSLPFPPNLWFLSLGTCSCAVLIPGYPSLASLAVILQTEVLLSCMAISPLLVTFILPTDARSPSLFHALANSTKADRESRQLEPSLS